jgi:hypothetical protein
LFELVVQIRLDVFDAISQPRKLERPQVYSREQVLAKLFFTYRPETANCTAMNWKIR